MRFLRAEPRIGGSSFYAMTFEGGSTMHGLLKYSTLEKPARIVYTQQFCDENERVMRPPFFSDWPETMLTQVELAPEGADRTRVTVRWEPYDGVTPADLAEFVRQRGSMTGGWTGSFDKLEALLGAG
jgi:uncharacterized protein YndB with AHSA1/START domain